MRGAVYRYTELELEPRTQHSSCQTVPWLVGTSSKACKLGIYGLEPMLAWIKSTWGICYVYRLLGYQRAYSGTPGSEGFCNFCKHHYTCLTTRLWTLEARTGFNPSADYCARPTSDLGKYVLNGWKAFILFYHNSYSKFYIHSEPLHISIEKNSQEKKKKEKERLHDLLKFAHQPSDY